MATILKSVRSGLNQVHVRWLLGLAFTFFAIALTLCLNRYYSLYPSYDHGIFNQVFWNGTHGRFFQSSLSSTLSSAVLRDGQLPFVSYHRLGQHFTPALLLWLPFYALYPSAVTLVVIQVALITAGGVVLYALARQYLQPGLSLMITASFYAANAVIGPTVSNFHDSSQTPLLVFSLFLALEKRVWWVFWLFAALVLLVREDAGVILFGIGIYLVLSRRFPRAGLALCTFSFGYILLATNVLMPLFSDDSSRRFTVEHFKTFTQGDEKVSTIELLKAMLSQPFQLIQQIISPIGAKGKYLLYQWLPLAFVPALSLPAWIMTGFPILALFIRDPNAPGDPLSIHLRYAITIIPGLFYGTILWWSRHQEKFRPMVRRFWLVCLALSLLLIVRHNPHEIFYFATPLKAISHDSEVFVPLDRRWQHVREVRSVLNEIPSDASVSATTYLVPPLSSRREIIRILGIRLEDAEKEAKYLPALELRNDRNEITQVEYVVADLWQMQQDQAVDENERKRLQAIVPILEQIISQGQYGLRQVRDGVVLLHKGTPTDPQALADWTSLRESLKPLLTAT